MKKGRREGMRVRQGEIECKGGGGAFKSGSASRKYEEKRRRSLERRGEKEKVRRGE